MAFKIGFAAESSHKKSAEATYSAPRMTAPRKSVVQVYFAGRNMTLAYYNDLFDLHRGDMVYYPENSIEGIISSVMMGADMVEIDPRLTKDGVFILLHDATLTRTTNVAEFAGKEGYPRTHTVSDWTLEQLKDLTLLDSPFGEKIVTLEEALQIVRGKGILILDKTTQCCHFYQ